MSPARKKIVLGLVLGVLILLVSAIWIGYNKYQQLILPEYCNNFIYDGGNPVDCSAVEGYIYDGTTAYVCIFDKITKNKNHYFLLVNNKNEQGRWFSQKFYLGEKNQYIGMKEQLGSDIRQAKIQTGLTSTQFQLKNLPLLEYNSSLSGREIILLVFDNEYTYQGLQKVSNIRYIK